MPAPLSSDEIRNLINMKPPLVESWINLEDQVQSNGFDLTVREVAMLQHEGTIAVENARRSIPDLAPLAFDWLNHINLMPGAYIITFNEIVNLPKNIMALAAPRSSLLRCGVSVHTAVWDAGYSGRSQSLMVVHNSRGFNLQKNARIVQLVFFELSNETEGYQGKYQRENV